MERRPSVLRSGSYGEAARRLGVSHPTLGRRIKVLEDEARQTLFRPTTDGAEWFANHVLALVITEPGRRHPAVIPEVVAACPRHYEHICTLNVHVSQCPNIIVLDSLNAQARPAGRA
jgi:hypothetical protein